MSRFIVQATWDDVPHLSKADREELLSQIPLYHREARTKGIPQFGAGAVYPILATEIEVADFQIPSHYSRGFGMNVGPNRTAAVWGARDDQSGVIYLYSEYYRSNVEPAVHSQGVKSRGDWIQGVIAPAQEGENQKDGKKAAEVYINEHKLKLMLVENAEEAGILVTWGLLSTGMLKVFKSLNNWLAEFRTFSRDETGKVKDSQKYSLMAATRYFMLDGRHMMKTQPKTQARISTAWPSNVDGGWMA